MKAVVYRRYGSPDVLEIADLPTPVPGDDDVLIRVHATTVGTWDCEMRAFNFPFWFWLPLRLAVGVRRPRRPVLGQELAGTVEAVGASVTGFSAGDRVFAATGLRFGGHAEYACISSTAAIAHMPANMSFEEAAGIPVGGDNALHFLAKAEVRPGEHVLVNGAGGNIGVLAVQLAKHYGAEVTAVDSADKLEMLRDIGADHVIDYTAEDFTRSGRTYDVIFDLVFSTSYTGCLRSLAPRGRYLLANPGFSSILRGLWTSATSGKKVVSAFAGSKPEDLVALRELADAGAFRAVIDRRYPLEQAAEAHAFVDTGQRRGTIVLTVRGEGKTASGPIHS
jgi:NADPH:quinone reductase-like Zn-dependent oxidoreductase